MTQAPPTRTDVIIAAGGLGTRVQSWSRFVPKEFYPLDQRPGLLHLLDEIRVLGAVNVVLVYHPYYEPFYTWVRYLFGNGAHRYDALTAALGCPPRPGGAPDVGDVTIRFTAQVGPYSDLSSLFNGARNLVNDRFVLVFADNLYADANPLPGLRHAAGDDPCVLVRPYAAAEVHRRGVIVAPVVDGQRRVVALAEKPTPRAALGLVRRWGEPNLFLVEGRFLLTRHFLARIDLDACRAGGEPKLSLAVGRYARHHPVRVAVTTSRVADLATDTPPPWLSAAS